jgi:glycerol-3-phosphate acyltransferase PlsY
MNLLIGIVAAAAGYLVGSISFARLIAAWAAGRTLAPVELHVPGSEERFRSDAVSATTVRLQVGPRYGCLTSVLDMLKAVGPMLALRYWLPGTPIYLVYAAAATLGHIWPLYHGFRGGRGQSPILASLFVLDPIGVAVTQVAALLLGRFVLRELLVINSGGFALMLPWIWLRTGDPWQTGFVAAMNGVFWLARRAELRQYFGLRRQGRLRTVEEAIEMMDMGRGMGRWMQRFSRR